MSTSNQTPNLSPQEVLEFTDIYIHMKNPESKSYAFYRKYQQTIDLNDDLRLHVSKMRDIIWKKYKETNLGSFRVAYRDRLYRCTLIKSVDGFIVECRSQPRILIPLSKIGLPNQIRNWVMNERLTKGGLILVVGAIGSGKTTTCAAIAKARIELFGGVLLTIEDPAELPMHGRIGKGLCIQYEIESKEDFLEAGRLAMRCYPADKAGIMFIGEIRDSESAALALRASLDGRLVVATMHGDSVISAIKRLVSYASKAMSTEEAFSLLYNGFRLCLHQKRTRTAFEVDFLADTEQVARLMLQGELEQLGSELDAQRIKMKNHEPIELRRT